MRRLFLSLLAALFLSSSIFGMQPQIAGQNNPIAAQSKNRSREFIIKMLQPKTARLMDQAVKAEQNECGICKEDFNDDRDISILKCDPRVPHIYHTECLKEWIAQHPNCPTCRKAIDYQPSVFKKNIMPMLNDHLKISRWEICLILLGLYQGYFNHLANQSLPGILIDSSAICVTGYLIPGTIAQLVKEAKLEDTIKKSLRGLISLEQLKITLFIAIYIWAISHSLPENSQYNSYDGFLKWYVSTSIYRFDNGQNYT